MSRRRERGAAAVEMALVLPVLVLLLGGIIDLGRAFMTEVILTNAAREGTRMALIDRDAATASASIASRATAATNGIDTVTVTPTPSDGCATGSTTQVSVDVSTSFNWLFLDALPGITSPQTITGTSVIGC